MVYNPYSLGGFGGFGGFGAAGALDPNQYDPFVLPGGQQPQFGAMMPFGAPMDPYSRIQQAWGAPQAPPPLSVPERNDQARNVPVGRDASDVPGFTSLMMPATSSMPVADDDLSKAMALSYVSGNDGSDGPAIEKVESEKPSETSGWRGAMGALGSVSNALLGFAGGALSGAPGNSGIGLGFQGMLQGSKLDQQNRILAQKDMEKRRKAEALKAFFAKRNLPKEVMDVAASDPETGLNIFEKLMTPKGVKYERVGNDLIRTNDDGSIEVVHRAPAVPSTVISNRYEGEYDKTRGKANAERFEGIIQAGQKVPEEMALLERMDALTRDPNFRSGALGETQMKARQALVALGWASPDIVKSTEEFHSHAAQAILNKLGGSLGSGVSNADAVLVRTINANLTNTPEANRLILDAARRFVKRKAEIRDLALRYEQEHGSFDTGFDAYLAKWAEENPLWSEEEKKQIIGATNNNKVSNTHKMIPGSSTPAAPTATGRNGERYELRNGKWVQTNTPDISEERLRQVY